MIRKALSLVIIALTGFSLVACKSEKKSEDIIVDKIIEKPQEGPQHMGNDERSGSVTWIGGAQYSYTITRRAVDSLGVVKNNGKQYYNNSIHLTVSRANGTVFFQKTFTKANFAPAMPKQFQDTGVLLGMNLELPKDGKVTGNQLRFVVSVGSPDESNEEFVYVLMTLDNYGATSAQPYKIQETPESVSE